MQIGAINSLNFGHKSNDKCDFVETTFVDCDDECDVYEKHEKTVEKAKRDVSPLTCIAGVATGLIALKKGSKVYIEGALQTRKFTDASGTEKYSTEIVLGAYRGELVVLDGRADGNGVSADATVDNSDAGWDSTAATGKTETFDDEIPF
jgi:hypothetical protein